MTEIEAIKEIEERVQITEHVGGSYVDCVDIEALRIAIFALKQMEKKQLPGENATSDCISRQGLRGCLLSEDYETHDYCFPCKKIMKRIDEQPSAQPEIIRCKDCRHWREQGLCGIWDQYISNDDFYCGCAERKEGEADD